VTAPGRPAGPSTGPRGGGADGDRGRALGTLTGLAIGDALGMPCQMMSRPEVLDRFGPHGLTGFEPADTDHPLAAGMAAGSVTDDTEQALVLARLLQAGGGRVDAADFVAALLDWEAEMRARGSLDLLGPSTRGALARVLAGESTAESGRFGVTSGAAMRRDPSDRPAGGFRRRRLHRRHRRPGAVPGQPHPSFRQIAPGMPTPAL
jgi:ADP-ribosylglycohydrolase